MKTLFIVVAILAALAVGFFAQPLVNPAKGDWKLIPIAKSHGYSNTQYPAYLLNEKSGKVILLGEASFDTNKDGEYDKWVLVETVLHEGEK